jgi:hypothetical protein
MLARVRVLSQIVVAGNAAPGYALVHSEAVREKLAFSRLKRMAPRLRCKVIHSVLRAIGTRYVGRSSRSGKVDAALHNFEVLVRAGGPAKFFTHVASLKTTEAKIAFLCKNLKFCKRKGCRDTLIELRLANDCVALDQRLRKILLCVGAKVPKSIDSQYEEIERELIDQVAKPSGFSGGELDRVLFQNAGDVMVCLLCP